MSASLSNPEQFRKSVTQRLLAAWECVPALRLGQLIDNSMDSVPMHNPVLRFGPRTCGASRGVRPEAPMRYLP